MRTLIYLFLLGSLLAGCASAGQTGIVQGGLAVTAAPAKAYPSALPDSTVPSPTAPDSEAALMAYDQSQKGYTLRKVNPATGEDVGGAPVRISSGDEYLPHLAYSADGSKLAAIESRGTSCEAFAGGVSCYPRAHAVQIIDLPTWQVISTTLTADGWAEAISFSPEAGKLAISYNHSKGSSVLVIDTASGEILSDLEIGFRPAGIAFYLDNRHLLVYGTLPAAEPGVTPPGALRVEAYLIPTGEKIWERELADVTSGSWCLENCTGEHGQQLYALWTPAILVSPQGDMLHILHADRNLLTRISLADGSRADVEVREAQSWLERLLAWSAGTALAKGGMEGATRLAAISADGKQLYVQTTTMKSEQNKDGFWAIVDETTELQAIDTHNGTILAQKPATGYGIRLTPDGKHLLFGTWTQSDVKTDVLSAKNLERVARLDGWEVAISPDTGGNLLLLGSRGTNTTTELTWIDPDSFQVQGSWKYKGQASWIPIR
jgi:hypothetical protein